MVQGVDRIQRDIADVRERMTESALANVSQEENVFASGEQVLRALANQPHSGGLPPALLRDLAGVIAGGFRIVFLVAAVIAACAALGACFLKETALRSAEGQPQEPGRQLAE